ncbi:MAG: alpha/beta hydrolase [Pseudomonadota bacterium]
MPETLRHRRSSDPCRDLTMAIVLIPGFMLDRDLWSDIAPALDPFGPLMHADPGAGSSIEDMARRTLQEAPRSFTLIGFSMGGYVARDIVRIAPERVSRLVLIATSSRGDSTLQARRKSQALGTVPETYGGVSRQSIRQSLAPAREHDAALIARIHAMSVRLGGETFRRQASFHRDGDTDRLADIGCPTLIVAGRQDRLRSLDEANELHHGIPRSRLVVLDAGHMIPLEAAGELATVLLDFMGG